MTKKALNADQKIDIHYKKGWYSIFYLCYVRYRRNSDIEVDARIKMIRKIAFMEAVRHVSMDLEDLVYEGI